MQAWQVGAAVFFLYVIAVALLLPGLGGRGRWRAAGLGAAGLAMAALSAALPRHEVLDGWIVPPALLLIGYWSSGGLLVAPMPWAERILQDSDRALGIAALASRTPRPVAELLEMAYAGVYPLIPIALVFHLLYTPGGDAARFWSVVLVTDFICFGMLPWFQTRPPRALGAADPWRASVRALNLRLLGAASIQANTFPSGHAAEAMAVALLVLGAPWPIVAAMAVTALAISAGAVLGRYHYALDALAGWLVAAGVWWWL
jgi:membrane-associated phospholipid phosphatase